MGDLSADKRAALEEPGITTHLKPRNDEEYKMLLLLAMLNADSFLERLPSMNSRRVFAKLQNGPPFSRLT